MLPATRHRRTAVLAALAAATLAVSGCSASHSGDSRRKGHHRSDSPRTERTQRADGRPGATRAPAAAAKTPRTAAQYLARARRAMAGEAGWTFAVDGRESATMSGQAPSGATYTATVHRTTTPVAVEQLGSVTTSKGQRKPESVYVVDGTGHVKKNGAWTSGPVTDPAIADAVEDPVAGLDAFAAYGKSAKVRRSGGTVRLEVTSSGWTLADARTRPALKKAARELDPTLAQLRDAGVTATETQIRLTRSTETWELDAAHGYRVAAHRFAFTFDVPYQGGAITVKQDVRADNRGVFDGTVRLPADAGR
ncbi:hypothetical protein [Streptomyces xanthii]|uniref:Lipoprotein n=1 Tax=Streptomyces xanthii TaxID=2768069 RepID=A0A7H1B707_9ACTN|nr:hypothetical protein [Streptomyces xanthii]QNS04512.1 hypothetical protein IAG42_13380 [Streptomyces xanthii]